MRKLIVFGSLLLVVVVLVLLFKRFIGDIRPAVLPPSKDITTSIEEQGAASAVGEPVDFPLMLPSGFRIGIFAKNLGNARDLAFSPQGTLLLSIPKSGKVVALPDKNNDGRTDEVREVLTGLNKPHGLAFFHNKLYVVEETRVVRYLWDEVTVTATREKELFSLPRGGSHTSRTITFNPSTDSTGSPQASSRQMFISIGSTCDVCFEKHEWLAAVIVSDADGNSPRLWAKGLRNAVFITVNPATDELWGTEMGRDFLGDNLPPDEINIIRNGRDYGWPVCYGNKVYDTKFNAQPRKVSPCEATEPPVYEIAAHSAPLGLTFINSPQFPKEWQGDLLVAYHGSWNRSTPIGYKVVRLNVEGNRVVGEEDFITGFLPTSDRLDGPGSALGRPVDVIFDPSTSSGQTGSLYISDDKAGVVYKIVRQ